MSCQCPKAQEWQILRPSSDLVLLQCRTKIKFYKRTEEAQCLNLTECKHLSLTSSACHTTLPDLAGWLRLQIRLWFKYRASAVPKNIILMYFGGIAFLQVWGAFFYVAWVKYLNLVWFWHKGSAVLWHKGSAMEPICNYLLQGRSTMSVLGLTNLVDDQPQRTMHLPRW